MKISNIRSQILVLPEADSLADTPENPNAARPIVIVRIGTAHLVAAAPNGLTVEYMGWMLKLFDGVAEFDPAAGELVLSDRPGLGLTFREDTIRQYGVAS